MDDPNIVRTQAICLECRERHQFSQANLALFLGCTVQSIKGWENKRFRMSYAQYLIVQRLTMCYILPETVEEMMLERKGQYVNHSHT